MVYGEPAAGGQARSPPFYAQPSLEGLRLRHAHAVGVAALGDHRLTAAGVTEGAPTRPAGSSSLTGLGVTRRP